VFYAGDGTSGIYIWGAQLEAGAFATSYIPTTTTSLTRNADVVSMTGTNFSSWYNQTAGAFVVGFDMAAWPNSPRIIGVSDGTSANRIRTYPSSGTVVNADIVVSSAIQGSVSPALPSGILTTGTHKLALAYAVGSQAASLDGNTVQTASPASLPTASVAYLGSIEANGSANYLNGHMQFLRYYPQRLTNAEVQAFSK